MCYEVDLLVARFGEWVDQRRKMKKKKGKGSYEPMYQTLDALLGVDEDGRRGGMSGDELKDRSKAYLDALALWRRTGGPPPNPTDYLGG